MRRLRLFPLVFSLSIALPALGAGNVEPAPPAAMTPAYAHALGVVIRLLVLPDAHGGEAIASEDSPEHELRQSFERQVTQQELERRFAPVFAKHLTEAQATLLAALSHSSVMRKPGSSALTPSDEKQIAALLQAPGAAAAGQAFARATEESAPILDEWMGEYFDSLTLRMLAVIAQGRAGLAAAPASDSPSVKLQSLGVPFMDKIALEVVSTEHQLLRSSQHAERLLREEGLSPLVAPANLVSGQETARVRAALGRAEHVLVRHMADSSAILKEFELRLAAIAKSETDAADAAVSELNDIYRVLYGTASAVTRLVKVNYRILDLADASRPRLRIVDGKLVFQDSAEAERAKALWNEANAIAGGIARLQAQAEAFQQGAAGSD